MIAAAGRRPTDRRPTARAWAIIVFAVGLAAWLTLAALFVLRLDGRAQDDHYITYRYALNLARGEGLVYNPPADRPAGGTVAPRKSSVERVFGLSEPGLALLLAALHAATGVDIPHAATFLYASALVLFALVMRLDTRRCHSRVPAEGRSRAAAGALLGGTLWIASSAVWTSHGSAGAAALALLALAAHVVETRPGLAGVLAGAAAWFRPDALAAAVLLGLLLVAERRRLPRRYLVAAGVVVLAGSLAAWLWFGTPLPETVAAKRADALAAGGGTWNAGLAFWRRAAALAPRHFGSTWRLLLIVGLLGQSSLWRRGGRAARLLVLYAAAVALAYSVLGVPFFSWYLLPVLAALLYGVGFAIAEAGGWAGRKLAGMSHVARGGNRGTPQRPGLAPDPGRSTAGRAATAAGFLLALAAATPLLLPFARSSQHWYRDFSGFGHLDTYRRAAAWLRSETPPDAAVAYVEIGVLGYESGRRIVDLMGLVTREVRPYLAARDVAGAFRAAPAEIVVFHTRGRLQPLVTRRWFRRAFAPVARFEDRTGEGGLTIYRRRPGSWLPPPRPPRLP